MTSRRSLLATLGLALPAVLFAGGAMAATGDAIHHAHHVRHHVHAASAHVLHKHHAHHGLAPASAPAVAPVAAPPQS
jgi:hypothetical protein